MSSHNSSWPSWRVGALVGAGAAVALGLAYVSGTYSRRPAKKDHTNANAEKTEKTEKTEGSSKPKRTEAKTGVKTDEFATVAKEYVKFRPRYPAEIVQDLIAYYDTNAKVPRSQALAVDVGTGSGQIAVPLAGHGFKVIGLDKSAAQLSQATAAPNVEYKVGSDTNTGVADGAASLVTVAQAAHWFDLPAFYKETKRILGPNGVMSIMGYAVCSISEPAEAQPIFAAYYARLNDYWPKDCDRDLLDSGFAAAQFPFDNVQRKWYPQRTTLRFQDFMGYLRTWSGLVQYKKEHPNPDDDPSVELERDLLSLDSISGPEAEIVITYPFFMINCTKPE